jgi:hypothetical protein
VSAAYVSQHEKLIFRNNKKLLNPDPGPSSLDLGPACRHLLAEVKVN